MRASGRRWHTSLVLVWRTAWRTVATLRRQRLGFLIPVFAFLLAAAIILWVINGIAPLAPFVYSLF